MHLKHNKNARNFILMCIFIFLLTESTLKNRFLHQFPLKTQGLDKQRALCLRILPAITNLHQLNENCRKTITYLCTVLH